MGFVFWGVFRFAVVSAAFSSHFLSSLASELFCCDLAQVKAWGIFQTSIAIDDNTSWSQHWGVLRFAVALFGMCEVCTEAVHSVFEHELHHRFGHVWSMYRSSPFRSTLNTSYITGLDMWKVCTEAVHSVELWTRATSQVWTCGKYVPRQSIP